METELAGLLLEEPQIVLRHSEIVAELPFTDPSLDRLRKELLNLAASGSSLEKAGVQTHFSRLGMADFAARLLRRNPVPDGGRQEAGTPEDDPEARFLRATQNLRQMADGTSELQRRQGARQSVPRGRASALKLTNGPISRALGTLVVVTKPSKKPARKSAPKAVARAEASSHNS